jgi:hypothetical protein
MLALHAYPVLRPMLHQDDIQILVRSITWPVTLAHLWEPSNEHTMPLGRISTWLMLTVAGGQTHFPFAAALQGPIATLVAMLLLAIFVKRELDSDLWGLVAAIIFGVTSIYTEAVAWFSASFAMLALDTALLGLLAAQAWRRRRHILFLILSALFASLAPCWFASGILAGPLCALYLLPDAITNLRSKGAGPSRYVSSLAFCVPAVGTAVFLAISLPLTSEAIMHTAHYEGKTALEAFHPPLGAVNTCRTLVDNLALGQIGVSMVVLPIWLVPIPLAFLIFAFVRWWRPVYEPRLLLAGLGFILLSYLLIYSARAEWKYGQMRGWLRYHAWPQAGFTMLLCAGLKWRAADPFFSRKRLLILVAVLFVLHLPRGILASRRFDPNQGKVLASIEETDALCRQHGIDRETACAALSEIRAAFLGEDVLRKKDQGLQVPDCAPENGWLLLRGAARSGAIRVDEARRILIGP